jgi:hypothetical protein
MTWKWASSKEDQIIATRVSAPDTPADRALATEVALVLPLLMLHLMSELILVILRVSVQPGHVVIPVRKKGQYREADPAVAMVVV